MRHAPLVLLFATLPLAAQTRSTALVGPAALGATCYARHALPPGLAGHVAGFLWSAPFAGAVPVTAPGLSANGLLRVDPTASVLLGVSVTDGSNLPTMPVAVPPTPALLGNQLDCQSFDLDLAGVFQLAGNDVTLTVVAGPNPALAMVAIAPGTFVMGSLAFAATFPNEQPPHPVTLTYPFWMGAHEVTQAQYQALMGGNPSHFQGAAAPNAAQRPVESVTWHDAIAYCAALTASEQAAGRVPAGYHYRLPTEAEWEYCCRAGTTTEWHTGTSLNTSQANIQGALANAAYPNGQTAVVGSYAPNAFGLHDMHGNVKEWCLDSFAAYTTAARVDPFVTGGATRMVRNGSYEGASLPIMQVLCRSPVRNYSMPGVASSSVGFRVVLGPIRTP